MLARARHLRVDRVRPTAGQPLTPCRPTAGMLHGDAAEAVAILKSETGPGIATVGSGELIQSLRRRNLIDEYVLLIHRRPGNVDHVLQAAAVRLGQCGQGIVNGTVALIPFPAAACQ